MRIRKLTKKMIFHKAKYFSWKKKTSETGKKAQYHNKMFESYKSKFHGAVQVTTLLKC
jgi:hypothetical protein